tara:strand:+ start:1126 stop:1590 length:465 start_codon:yes stop_codon:yes gene_type:complete
MKQLFLFASMMLSVTAYSQWKTDTYVDDFGEETGEEFQYFHVDGIFSNSATTNSTCGFFLKHSDGELYSVTIYPYNRDVRERWTESTYQDIKLKTPSGEVKTIAGFCYKKGLVLFSDQDYQVFKDAIVEEGEYTFLLKHNTKYSHSSYRFKFKV